VTGRPSRRARDIGRVDPAREPAASTVSLRTRDGIPLHLRPLVPSDRPLLIEGYRTLSDRSRFARYGTLYEELGSAQLDFLDHLDGVDNVAWGALVEAPTLLGVGVARYVRYRDRAHAIADVAVVVVDEWQGRGVGTALLTRLASEARAAGVEAFSTIVLADNDAALELCRRYGAHIGPVEDGAVEVRLELAAVADQIS